MQEAYGPVHGVGKRCYRFKYLASVLIRGNPVRAHRLPISKRDRDPVTNSLTHTRSRDTDPAHLKKNGIYNSHQGFKEVDKLLPVAS